MLRKGSLLFFSLIYWAVAFAQDNSAELETLRQWRAAEYVSNESVELFGVERAFRVEPISDQIFGRMKGKSYKDNCTIPREELRYLKILHYDAEGRIRLGEMVCHESVSEDLLHIFRKLYEARYPIEKMVLVDEYGASDDLSMRDNNSSAFNFRFIVGSSSVLSAHSRGVAVDINPLYNPYVKVRNGRRIVEPATAEKYVDREAKYDYKIVEGDLLCRLMKEYGFEWGGDWKSLKDYQHFEKK